MRILMVEPGGRGGICQHAHNLANGLAARGHVVVLATGIGCETARFPRAYRAIEVFDRFVPRPLRLLRLLAFTARFGPDVVHIEGAVHPGSYYAIWRMLRPFARCRFVYTAHDVFSKKKRPYHPWVLRRIYRGMDHVLVNAERNKEEIVEGFGGDPGRISFVPVGDLVAFVRDVPAQELAGVPAGRRRVLFFGNIEPRKGLMTLIRAFRRVRDEVPDAVLAVMGRPFEDVAPYRAEIARLGLADAISFRPDYVPLEMISSVLGWADLLVLPYERAWNSGIILSAYAFGKPVVSTAVSGLSEVVEDGRTGLVVPPGDADALAAAIVRILADDRLRAAMSEAARAAAARHSWAAIAEQTERAYRAG